MIFDELYQYSLHDTDLTDFSFDAIENRFVLEELIYLETMEWENGKRTN